MSDAAKLTLADVRAALDASLREADTDAKIDGHAWGQRFDCASHNEGLACCVDPHHDNYGKLLDDLAARVAKRLGVA